MTKQAQQATGLLNGELTTAVKTRTAKTAATAKASATAGGKAPVG